LRVGTLVLQTATAAGCTLLDIATLMCDPDTQWLDAAKARTSAASHTPHDPTGLAEASEASEAAEVAEVAEAAEAAKAAEVAISAEEAKAAGGIKPAKAQIDLTVAAMAPLSERALSLGANMQMSPVSVMGCNSQPGDVALPCDSVSAWEVNSQGSGGAESDAPTKLQRLCHQARLVSRRMASSASNAPTMSAEQRARREEATFLDALGALLAAHFAAVRGGVAVD